MTGTHPHLLMEEHEALKKDNQELTTTIYALYKKIENLNKQLEYLESKIAEQEDQLELFSKERLK
jgi:predicted  nucleic acid-binding Zn-ribbon protein